MAQESVASPRDRGSPRLKARMAGAFYLLTFLWLLLFGVNAHKWIEQSRLHTQPAFDCGGLS